MPKMTLKMLRARDELTQKKVAEKLGIATSTWSKWESGKSFPDVMDIQKIEKLFSVEYSDIIFLSKNTVKPFLEI